MPGWRYIFCVSTSFSPRDEFSRCVQMSVGNGTPDSQLLFARVAADLGWLTIAKDYSRRRSLSIYPTTRLPMLLCAGAGPLVLATCCSRATFFDWAPGCKSLAQIRVCLSLSLSDVRYNDSTLNVFCKINTCSSLCFFLMVPLYIDIYTLIVLSGKIKKKKKTLIQPLSAWCNPI